jgi:hypothetical protein
MQLSEHFSLAEMTVTTTGLSNVPSNSAIANLVRTARLLESIRDVLKFPIFVSSGFRSEAVNHRVGGASTSAHLTGNAADFTCPSFGTPAQICEAIVAAGISFDQLILEFNNTSHNEGGDWVHIGLATNLRQQILTGIGGHYLPGLVVGKNV